jgi:hypothetical protein
LAETSGLGVSGLDHLGGLIGLSLIKGVRLMPAERPRQGHASEDGAEGVVELLSH